MTLHLRQAVLILIFFSVAACSPAWQKIGYQSKAPNSAAGVSDASSAEDGFSPSPESTGAQTTGDAISPIDGNSQETADGSAYTSEDQAQSLSGTGFSSEEEKPKDTQQVLDEALELCEVSQDFWGQGDFENAIASLDQAYNLILQPDTDNNPKFIQQKADIRFMICKRMLEIYASRHIVANGNSDAIPMVMNRYVEKEINLFKGPERRFFIESYKRSGRYRPHILKALKEAGLPKELSWLPLIESGFKLKALSRARALGLWQFIPSTGYKFGLSRDRWIDERMDVHKSTQAAIAYLQELHKIFGDWCTVLAGYNCGEARVLRVIRNQNIAYLDNFWDLFQKLPWETARYVPRFMAALHIINDPEKFGFSLLELDTPLDYELVTVSKQVRLKDIAKALNVYSESLVMLNPELRYNVTPPTPYELRVPTDQASVLLVKIDDIPVYKPPRSQYVYHRVRRGETLSALADRYRTPVRAIMQASNLRNKHVIRVGQRLKIPLRGQGRRYSARAKTISSDPSQPLRHRVNRGDSLWLLARQYGTNIKEIVRLNKLKTTHLHIGQKLIMRTGTQQVEPSEGTKTYRVKSGDSPYQIAVRHEMRLTRLLRINDLTTRSKIYPGQVILVDVK